MTRDFNSLPDRGVEIKLSRSFPLRFPVRRILMLKRSLLHLLLLFGFQNFDFSLTSSEDFRQSVVQEIPEHNMIEHK